MLHASADGSAAFSGSASRAAAGVLIAPGRGRRPGGVVAHPPRRRARALPRVAARARQGLWARSRRSGSRGWWRGCSRARRRSSWPPRPTSRRAPPSARKEGLRWGYGIGTRAPADQLDPYSGTLGIQQVLVPTGRSAHAGRHPGRCNARGRRPPRRRTGTYCHGTCGRAERPGDALLAGRPGPEASWPGGFAPAVNRACVRILG